MDQAAAVERLSGMLGKQHVHGVAPSADGKTIQVFVSTGVSDQDLARIRSDATSRAGKFKIDVVVESPPRLEAE